MTEYNCTTGTVADRLEKLRVDANVAHDSEGTVARAALEIIQSLTDVSAIAAARKWASETLVLRNVAILSVLFEAGPRSIELRNLNRDQFRKLETGWALFIDGSRARSVCLSEETAAVILAYLITRSDDNRALFATARPAKGTRLAASDVADLVHDLTGGKFTPLEARHAAAVLRHEQAGLSAPEIAALLGADLRTVTSIIRNHPLPNAA